MTEHYNGGHEEVDDIVITGISVRLPLSSNLEEFQNNLMNGVDMVTEDERRWPFGLYGLPRRSGKIDVIDRFDSEFFGGYNNQIKVMDPQLRIMTELTYEAIIDSGTNPQDIAGSNTGVFIGATHIETQEYWSSDPERNDGYSIMGAINSMFANRISYLFDFRGPSFAVDTACSSSAQALYQAFYHMRAGICDSAIVGGANLCLKPGNALCFVRLNMLSADGKCKTFDADANGYARSEGVVVIFLQKKSRAFRMYSSVISVMINTDGAKEHGLSVPSTERQRELAEKVYKSTGIDPNTVSYIEAHGTGTKVGDPLEVNAIIDVFCSKRKVPLLIGSVKTNMGHTESCSALCSIAKIIVSMETGMFPPNLHFNTPNPDIVGLQNGKLKVLTEKTSWNGGLVAMNSFGFGGANVHILLKSNPKEKILSKPVTLPRLVTVSGRTEEAVEYFLNYVINKDVDPEFCALIDNVHRINIKGHNYRGYTVLGSTQKEIKISSQVRPVWFLFSGMGSQWPRMAREMMALPVFRNSVEKSAMILRQFDLNLIDILVNSTPEYFDNILNSFVSIAAVQIALVDLLHSINIKADGLIGHSTGELGCAYADGGFTAEQTILSAYWRGHSSLEVKLDVGSMAAVSLSKKDFEARNPPGIFIACYNSENNITISGPSIKVKKFVEELKMENIFARLVNTGGIAFHSKYIEPVAPVLLKKMENIITNPKPRSSSWISTSVLEENWDKESAKLCSAEYFVNNMISCVNFHNATKHIPDNAILIEIAPHALLQGIVNRSLPETVTNISLMKRDNEDNVKYFLNNIGKLYIAGAQPHVGKLYEPISLPVSRGTPMLAPCIKWNHSIAWEYPDFNENVSSTGDHNYVFDLSNPEDSFLIGHTIDGRVLFPATGYLVLVWRSLAKLKKKNIEMIPVIFEDVEVMNATVFPKQGKIKFTVNIVQSTGCFNVAVGNTVAVTGTINICEEPEKETLKLDESAESLTLNANDLYKELWLRGYEYSGIFKRVVNCSENGSRAIIAWQNNWIAFLDNILHPVIISERSRKLHVPVRLQSITIDPKKHLELVNSLSGEKHIPLQFDDDVNVIQCGGVEFRGLETSPVARKIQSQSPITERYTFVPYEGAKLPSKEEALRTSLQIALENVGVWDLKLVEVTLSSEVNNSLSPKVRDILQTEPNVQIKISIAAAGFASLYADMFTDSSLLITSRDIRSGPVENECHLVLARNVIQNNELDSLPNMLKCLVPRGFILLEENTDIVLSNDYFKDFKKFEVEITSIIKTEDHSYLLLHKTQILSQYYNIVTVTEKDFTWVENLKQVLMNNENADKRIYVVSQNERTFGAMGLVNCLWLEPGGQRIRLFFIQDDNMELFNVKLNIYKRQIEKDLLINVYQKDQWGSYRHFPFSNEIDSELLPREHAYVNNLTRGDLSSLRWIESPIKANVPDTDICFVYYSALNFKDILLAKGKISMKPYKFSIDEGDYFGMEYSGIAEDSKRIMGIVPRKGIATSVVIDPVFTWSVPDKWTLEQAATVPVVYTTVYYGLLLRGNFHSGESILIHAGAGGVGIAAITIALHMGCTVFTTVGSEEKREFIKKYFPQIPDKHIGNSRDTSFEYLVNKATKGRGVDVVLNALAEDKLKASVRCLASQGRFVEIGKEDMLKNNRLAMKPFLMNISFHGVHLDMFLNETSEMKKEIARTVAKGIESGAVQPLPVCVFDDSQLEKAFKFMATGKHIGKVLIQLRKEENNTSIPPLKLVNAVPKLYMNSNKSYIIVGGLGGFGLELCHWFISLGARNLVISSSRGMSTGYQYYCINRWRKHGIKVNVSTADVTTLTGAYEIIEEALKLAPIGGIFNLALVLKDAIMENQTKANFQAVIGPKVLGTKNLDIASRNLAPTLDHFVVFSSLACGRGNAGQSNYGLANSAMERICEMRKEEGLPGLAIQWGPVADVGLVSEMMNNDTVINGTIPQNIVSCLNVLSTLMLSPYPVVSSLVLAEKLSKSNSEDRLITTVANILGIKNLSNIEGSTKLSDLGLDSFVTTEIKQTLERNFSLSFSTTEVKLLTFDMLKKIEEESETSKNDGKGVVETGKISSIYSGDDLVEKQVLVKLPSKETNASDKLPVFFIHPIEGHVRMLREIAAKLERPVYGLQLTSACPLTSISDLVDFYIEHIRTVQNTGPYIILGYSLGTMIAFEMALKLEKDNIPVQLVLVDGSPDYLSTHADIFKVKTIRSPAHFESIVLSYFTLRFQSENITELRQSLVSLKNWNERLDYIHSILKNFPHSKEELNIAAELMYKICLAGEKYVPMGEVQGSVILFTATVSTVECGLDYGLSRLCKQQVDIHPIEADHQTIVCGEAAMNVASYIIHPIEGHVRMLREIAAKLERPVYGLQLTSACPLTSISDLVDFYIEHIRTVQNTGPYIILGYSLGTMIAFEMALKLEKDNIPVQLVLVDGSPDYLSTHADIFKVKTIRSPAHFESIVLSYFTLRFQSENITELRQSLVSLKNWNERLDYIHSILKDLPHSKEELNIAAEFMYKICLAGEKYVPMGEVQGSVILFTATESTVECGLDYGLSRLCKQQVDIHPIEADHQTIVCGEAAMKVASYIV